MNKTAFEIPKVDILYFDNEDVITSSNETPGYSPFDTENETPGYSPFGLGE